MGKTPAPVIAEKADFEPRIWEILEAKLARREQTHYRALTNHSVLAKLDRLLRANGVTDFSIEGLSRMPGGASKEQFWFDLVTSDAQGNKRERMVLRMDPREGIVETCRFREAEVLQAFKGHVPVVDVRFLDGDGAYLGQPGVVTGFVRGVSKPPTNEGAVLSGVGTTFNKQWRDRLTPQFMTNLAKIHAFDWSGAELPHFAAPTAYPTQAAAWQVNWWTKVWRDDLVHPYPLFTLTERWMRERLPACEEPVMLHGDYRTSNFMFDAETGEFTAVLDWELAHIGDFHEDLGWIVQKLFAGPPIDGETHICGLMTREDFLEGYEAITGRRINYKTLAFYEAFAGYKLAGMNLGSSIGAAERRNNHQDIVLTYLAAVGHTFLHQLVDAIREEAAL